MKGSFLLFWCASVVVAICILAFASRAADTKHLLYLSITTLLEIDGKYTGFERSTNFYASPHEPYMLRVILFMYGAFGLLGSFFILCPFVLWSIAINLLFYYISSTNITTKAARETVIVEDALCRGAACLTVATPRR
jgi:hypothetical protein